jgi:hypothetical protein
LKTPPRKKDHTDDGAVVIKEDPVKLSILRIVSWELPGRWAELWPELLFQSIKSVGLLLCTPQMVVLVAKTRLIFQMHAGAMQTAAFR